MASAKQAGGGLAGTVKNAAKGLVGGVLAAGKRKLEAEPTRIGVGVAAGVNALLTKVGKQKGLTRTQLDTFALIVNLAAAEAIRSRVTPVKGK